MFFKFHVKYNAAWTYYRWITLKKETSDNEAIFWRFGATVQQKENGVTAHSGVTV